MTQRKQVQLEQAVIRAARDYCEFPGFRAIKILHDAIRALDAHLDEIASTRGYTGPNSPDTSVRAAVSMKDLTGRLRHKIVDELYLDAKQWDQEHEGLTCEQLELRLGEPHTSVSSAIYYLRRAGWLFDSGRVRSNRSGRDATVYRLTPAGYERISNP